MRIKSFEEHIKESLESEQETEHPPLQEETKRVLKKLPVRKVVTIKGQRPWLVGKSGWLANEGRRNRRDQVRTLTDDDVKQLIEKVECKLPEPWDRILESRDKALIALPWTFVKRGSEVLNVKVQDVAVTEKELLVTFTILKKTKQTKTCYKCNKDNFKNASMCKYCRSDLSYVMPTRARPPTVTKRKTLQYPFCTYIVEWLNKLKDELKADPFTYLFPRFSIRTKTLAFHERITVQRFAQILQQLDNSLFTHIFRYGCAEKYLDIGYTPSELKEIGDWSSSYMPELYAKRKGQTRTQRRFAEDITKW